MAPADHRDSDELTDQDYQRILAFRDQLRRFLSWSEEQARAVGLTPAWHQLLLAIRGHPGPQPPTIGDLAEHLQLRHHSVVGLIDRAEATHLVRRVPDREDRRVARVTLEPDGRAALAHLTTLHLAELAVLADASQAFSAVPRGDEPAHPKAQGAPRQGG